MLDESLARLDALSDVAQVEQQPCDLHCDVDDHEVLRVLLFEGLFEGLESLQRLSVLVGGHVELCQLVGTVKGG